jgi:hypothetical protein
MELLCTELVAMAINVPPFCVVRYIFTNMALKTNLLGGAKELRRQRNIYVYATWLSWFNGTEYKYQRVFNLTKSLSHILLA